MRRLMINALLPLAVACSSLEPAKVQEPREESRRVTVRSSLQGQADCSYLFFDEDGLLTHSVFDCADTVSFLVRPGRKTVAAFRNVPSSTLSALSSTGELSTGSVLFSDNSSGGTVALQMFGTATAGIESNAPASVNVQMERYVFRIRLRSICNSLECPLEYSEVNYVGVFLENVPSALHLDGSPCAGCNLISAGGRCPSGFILSAGSDAGHYQESLLTVRDNRQNPVCIPSFETVQIQSDFLYAFPDDISANLRIVVAVEIDSVTYYYPVGLSNLVSNESVCLDLTIKKPGSDDPDKPVLGSQAAELNPYLFEDGPVLDIVY